MTTTIVAASGAAPLYTQQGVGTTPGYAALDDRRANVGPMQAGVYGTSTLVTAGGVSNVGQADFMVTQRNAGANMSVDINMPSGGFAWVQGATINGQGLYCVPVHSANISETIAAADPSNPRVDQIILEVQDNVLDASGGNLARTRVVTGTPTATASLTNRLGAPAIAGSYLLLADVLVGAGVSSVGNAVIRDRRKWARGAFVRQLLTSGSVTSSSGSLVAISSSLLARIECSGVPVRVTLVAIGSNSTANDGVETGCWLDGAVIDGVSTPASAASSAANNNELVGYSYVGLPAAGSHTFQPAFKISFGGTATVLATTTYPCEFVVEEVVRQNTANNTVTTG